MTMISQKRHELKSNWILVFNFSFTSNQHENGDQYRNFEMEKVKIYPKVLLNR